MNKSAHKQTNGIVSVLAGIALLFVTGCTKTTDALDSGAQAPLKEGVLVEKTEVDAAKDESGARIIHEKPSVSKKGTNIRVLVNRSPITNYDIKRRAAFLRLRRVGGNRTQKATDELIDEKIKMQEAAKRNSIANDSLVNKAFAGFAKRNKLSTKQMGQIMGRAGVSAKHFKEFLRVQISWQRTVSQKFRSNSREQSQADALFSIRKSGEAKPETREYKLQQVIFVVPAKKRKRLLKSRAVEARAFRQQFTSCTDTLGQVKLLRDVAIKELGRILEPELPPRWKEEVIKTAAGKTTRVKETEKGVEIIAVCSVRSISDDRAAHVVTQSKEFEGLNSKGDKVANDYLRELRSTATIVYR